MFNLYIPVADYWMFIDNSEKLIYLTRIIHNNNFFHQNSLLESKKYKHNYFIQ